MKLDPRHIEILAAVVDSGGMTDGAASLARSQPSLSRTIAMLEARLGTRLFHPGRRPLRPAELGLRLADEGRRIVRGELDLAICPLHAKDRTKGLHVDPILPGHNVIACREGHPLAKTNAVTEADLLGYFWIAPPSIRNARPCGAADLTFPQPDPKFACPIICR